MKVWVALPLFVTSMVNRWAVVALTNVGLNEKSSASTASPSVAALVPRSLVGPGMATGVLPAVVETPLPVVVVAPVELVDELRLQPARITAARTVTASSRLMCVVPTLYRFADRRRGGRRQSPRPP